MNAFQVFNILLKSDLKLAFRQRSEFINPLLFFVIVVSLFPLAVTPDQNLLRTIGPGIVWVAALLAALLAMTSLFRSDYEDGCLEQLLLTPHSLSFILLAKVFAHWLVSSVPLIIMAPLLALMLHLPPTSIVVLLISLTLGTLLLSLIGSICAALTVGLRNNGILLSLLVLPLYVPVLIFGTSAVIDISAGLPVSGQLALLGAMLVLALTLAPFASAAALRVSVD